MMIEIYTRNFNRHITVPSPNFLCRNLDYKPYSINQSINQYTATFEAKIESVDAHVPLSGNVVCTVHTW